MAKSLSLYMRLVLNLKALDLERWI